MTCRTIGKVPFIAPATGIKPNQLQVPPSAFCYSFADSGIAIYHTPETMSRFFKSVFFKTVFFRSVFATQTVRLRNTGVGARGLSDWSSAQPFAERTFSMTLIQGRRGDNEERVSF
jgi:hypothetical protein